MTDKIVVFTTCDSLEIASKLARNLVEQRLAACVNILPGARSIYRWQEKIEDTTEWLLVIKSRRDLFFALRTAVEKLHTYEVPELIAIPVVDGSEPYLAWLDSKRAHRSQSDSQTQGPSSSGLTERRPEGAVKPPGLLSRESSRLFRAEVSEKTSAPEQAVRAISRQYQTFLPTSIHSREPRVYRMDLLANFFRVRSFGRELQIFFQIGARGLVMFQLQVQQASLLIPGRQLRRSNQQ